MDIFTQGLETERMYLVPLHEKYLEDYFREFNEEIITYMTPCLAQDIEETRSWIRNASQKMEQQEKIYLFGIDKINQTFIGNFTLGEIQTYYPEGGIWVKKDAQWKGLWKEGMSALTERAQSSLNFEYILYPVDKDNLSSRKVAEFVGGLLEVDKDWSEIVKREATADPKKFLNVVHYKIYKHDK